MPPTRSTHHRSARSARNRRCRCRCRRPGSRSPLRRGKPVVAITAEQAVRAGVATDNVVAEAASSTFSRLTSVSISTSPPLAVPAARSTVIFGVCSARNRRCRCRCPRSRKSSSSRPASPSSPSPPSRRLAPASPRMMSSPRPPSTSLDAHQRVVVASSASGPCRSSDRQRLPACLARQPGRVAAVAAVQEVYRPRRPASRLSPSPPSRRFAPASPRMMSSPRPPSTFSTLDQRVNSDIGTARGAGSS